MKFHKELERRRLPKSKGKLEEDLRVKITTARSAMQLLPLNLKRVNVGQLKRVWRETYEQAKTIELIE
jgi:hypothetical protein